VLLLIERELVGVNEFEGVLLGVLLELASIERELVGV
jgi:hypothetical protein